MISYHMDSTPDVITQYGCRNKSEIIYIIKIKGIKIRYPSLLV